MNSGAKWLVYLAILGGINALSWAFDWGYWIY